MPPLLHRPPPYMPAYGSPGLGPLASLTVGDLRGGLPDLPRDTRELFTPATAAFPPTCAPWAPSAAALPRSRSPCDPLGPLPVLPLSLPGAPPQCGPLPVSVSVGRAPPMSALG